MMGIRVKALGGNGDGSSIREDRSCLSPRVTERPKV